MDWGMGAGHTEAAGLVPTHANLDTRSRRLRPTWRRYEKAPARRRTGAKLATTLKIREISGETTRMLYSARELVGGQMNLR
jgi:hypothetical protein